MGRDHRFRFLPRRHAACGCTRVVLAEIDGDPRGDAATMHAAETCTAGFDVAEIDANVARHLGWTVPAEQPAVSVTREQLRDRLAARTAAETERLQARFPDAFAEGEAEGLAIGQAVGGEMTTADWAELRYQSLRASAGIPADPGVDWYLSQSAAADRRTAEFADLIRADAAERAAAGPIAPATAPPAGAVPPAGTVPPELPLLPDPEGLGPVVRAAVAERQSEAVDMIADLAPALMAMGLTMSEATEEVAALQALPRGMRAEAVAAVRSGRMARCGVWPHQLLPTSRGAQAAWAMLRDAVLAVDRWADGGAFILDIPEKTPAVWGCDDSVLWAEGEALLIAGPQGVGKSTLAGNLVHGMIAGGTELLGFSVAQRQRILYLAMDRPQQIARALRRQLAAIPREVLAERLIVWQGPPPEDLAANPERLAAMCAEAGADVVVVDSLKDAALGLSTDEVGAGWNRARQGALAAGVQVVELHHDRKANDVAAPAIEKLYGSTWITAGAGSVIHLAGEPGDPVVKFRHLKQPSDEVAPFEILHDGASGSMTIHGGVDLLDLCRRQGGVTVTDAAAAIYDNAKPTSADREKVRRRLEKLAASGAVQSANIGGVMVYTGASYTAFEVPGGA